MRTDWPEAWVAGGKPAENTLSLSLRLLLCPLGHSILKKKIITLCAPEVIGHHLIAFRRDALIEKVLCPFPGAECVCHLGRQLSNPRANSFQRHFSNASPLTLPPTSTCAQ